MTLNDIIQNAQGGQGVNNLASQFGLTPEQAQAAIQAMIPAFSMGLQRTAQDPTGLGGILSQLTNAVHQASYNNPAQAGASGGGALGQIFGSPEVAAQLGQRISQMSGVNAQIIQQMMPVVASMLMGGLFHSMNGQGFGGVLGQLANAVNNAGGPAGAANPPGETASAQPAGGGLGGLVGGLFGSLMGGAPQAAAVQAGLGTLGSMFEAGVQVAETHQQGIRDILNSLNPQTGQ